MHDRSSTRLRSALLSLLAALALFTAAAPARAEEQVVKIATIAPGDTPWTELLQRYKDAVEKKSQGRLKVKLFVGGTLGDENETVIKCKRGQIQAVAASTGAVASQVPELNVLEIAYLFRTGAEADYVIDSVLTPSFDKAFRQYGLVLGFWSENGFRQFATNDVAATSPAALKGKKMRSQESPVHLDMWKAFGASPVPIPTTEVLTALQMHTVDGFDQSALFAIAAGWYKTTKYFTISNHIYQPAVIAFNQTWFDALAPDLQKILIDEGRTLQDKGRKAVRGMMSELLAGMTASGVKVQELTDAERAVFEKAAQPVRKQFRKSQGPAASKLLDAAEKALTDFRAGKVK